MTNERSRRGHGFAEYFADAPSRYNELRGMQQVGRYKIVGELGRGAMGVVYRAEDPAIGRTVAIKTIRLSDVTLPKERMRLRDRLFREARSAGILSHPGIVTIYDIQEEDGMAYVFMEFVDGPTLEQLLIDQPPAKERLLELLRQTAAALDYAHSKGIVHRDIKPANIMIDGSGAVKITDFGVAKIASQQATQAGMIMGTPSYMAPEQIEDRQVDGRTDQFALGVITFELLTGEKPFVSESLPSLLFKIVREDPVAPQRLNPTLGPHVEAVLRNALAKKPADRYETCEKFIQALAAACESKPGWEPMALGASGNLPTVAGTADGDVTTAMPSPFPAPPMPSPAPPVATLAEPKAAPKPAIPVPPPEEPASPPPHFRREQNQPIPARSRAGVALAFIAGLIVVGLGIFGVKKYAEGSGEPPVAQVTPTPPPPDKPSAMPTPGSPLTAAAAAEEPAPPAPTEPPPTPTPEARPARAQEVAHKAAPAVPSEFAVRVVTSPPGGTVVFDNNTATACRAPCEITFAPGRHTLAATLGGFRQRMRIFEVPKEQEIVITLERSTGTMMVKSIPPGASIVLNGSQRAEKTPAMLTLPAGAYKLEVKMEGFRAWEQDVDVKDGAVTHIDVNWK